MAFQCLGGNEQLLGVVPAELDDKRAVARPSFLTQRSVERYLTIAVRLIARIHLGVDHGCICQLNRFSIESDICLWKLNDSLVHHIVWTVSAMLVITNEDERTLKNESTHKLALIYHRRQDVFRASEHFPIKIIAL